MRSAIIPDGGSPHRIRREGLDDRPPPPGRDGLRVLEGRPAVGPRRMTKGLARAGCVAHRVSTGTGARTAPWRPSRPASDTDPGTRRKGAGIAPAGLRWTVPEQRETETEMSYWVNADYSTRAARVHTSECSHVDPSGRGPGSGLWGEFRTFSLACEAASVLIGKGDVQMCDVCQPGSSVSAADGDGDGTLRSSATLSAG